MKLISFAVPCYNSAEYMDKCIESLLTAGEEAEILIINDGSNKDDTAEIADGYAARYPDICRAIHKENGGHGDAVYTGLQHATGLFFKVVDSDDWLDAEALSHLMDAIRRQEAKGDLPDLMITNYVYERVYEGKRHTNSFKKILPEGRIFTWEETGRFNRTHYLTMHTLTYRTQVLRESGVTFPKHTFYVDNIYAYVPLDRVEKLYYIDADMYRYFIGREDQSVNEKTMIGRLDQQLLVNGILIDACKPQAVKSKKQRNYITHYLQSMMMVSSIFCMLAGGDALEKKTRLWAHLKNTDPKTYKKLRYDYLGIALNFKSKLGCAFCIAVYRVMQKIYKFN